MQVLNAPRTRQRLVDALVIGILIVPLYAINGHWGPQANVDVIAATAPAWQVVENGSLDLSAYEGQNPWFVKDPKGRVLSDRAPGLIASAVPGYLLWRTGSYTNAPGTLVALVTTVAAVYLVWWVLIPLVGRRFAVGSALVFGLGTTTWAVSSSQLWPHGIGQLLAITAASFMSRDRFAHAGIASALATTVRPITATYAAVFGVWEGLRRKDWRPVVIYGSLTLVGAIVVVAYYRWLFGTWTLSGGHGSGLTGGFSPRSGLGAYLMNVVIMFVSPRHGFLILSPILAVASVGIFRSWKSVPGWARSAAMAALVYLLVHAVFNRASGGMQIFYRYPLEAIALAAPALGVGARNVWNSRRGRFLVLLAAGISVAIQFAAVFYLSCLAGNPHLASCFAF